MKKQLKLLGFRAGRQTIRYRLPDLSWRLLNLVLKILKAEHRAREDARRRRHRVTIRILARGAVMGQDSAHVGNCRKKMVWAEVQKDLAILEGRSRGNGKTLTGQAMLGHLRRLKAKGRLPLVLSTDNGSAYSCTAVEAWLKRHLVVHLRSRLRTPTDNAATERAIGEGRTLSGLGKGIQLRRAVDGPRLLDKALQVLNRAWPRSSRGGKTSRQLRQSLPHWRATVVRRVFYQTVQRAIRRRTQGLKGRKLRRETREAIFATLSRFGLARRWKGSKRLN